jgi:transposase
LIRAYSQDLRVRIVEALEAHEESQAEIAERYVVSLSFVAKLWQRWRVTGSCAHSLMGAEAGAVCLAPRG